MIVAHFGTGRASTPDVGALGGHPHGPDVPIRVHRAQPCQRVSYSIGRRGAWSGPVAAPGIVSGDPSGSSITSSSTSSSRLKDRAVTGRPTAHGSTARRCCSLSPSLGVAVSSSAKTTVKITTSNRSQPGESRLAFGLLLLRRLGSDGRLGPGARDRRGMGIVDQRGPGDRRQAVTAAGNGFSRPR